MKETLISFETAKMAYEKGYTREVVGTSFMSTRRNYYNTQGELNGDCTDFIKDILKYGKEKAKVKHVLYPATSQSLLQRWLREEHRIFLNSITGYELDTRFQVYYEKDGIAYDDLFTDMFDKYEDALEDGLYQALKLIKL
jgi:hypothetical protein